MTSQNPVFVSVKTHQGGVEVLEWKWLMCLVLCLLPALSLKGLEGSKLWGKFVLVCLGFSLLLKELGSVELRSGWDWDRNQASLGKQESLCVCDARELPQKSGQTEIRGFLSCWKCWSVALCSEPMSQSGPSQAFSCYISTPWTSNQRDLRS